MSGGSASEQTPNLHRIDMSEAALQHQPAGVTVINCDGINALRYTFIKLRPKILGSCHSHPAWPVVLASRLP